MNELGRMERGNNLATDSGFGEAATGELFGGRWSILDFVTRLEGLVGQDPGLGQLVDVQGGRIDAVQTERRRVEHVEVVKGVSEQEIRRVEVEPAGDVR